MTLTSNILNPNIIIIEILAKKMNMNLKSVNFFKNNYFNIYQDKMMTLVKYITSGTATFIKYL